MPVPKSLGDMDTIAGAGADTFLVVIEKPAAGPDKIALLTASALGGGAVAVAWGAIGGTLASQTDLAAALADKASASHTHPDATTTAAGLFTAAEKVKLNGIQAGADVSPTASGIVTLLDAYFGNTAWRTDGGGGGTVDWGAIGGTLASQTDLAAALADKASASHTHPDATTTAAGLFTAAEKVKLSGIEAAAEVNPTAAEIITLLDAHLGGSDWRTGGGGGTGSITWYDEQIQQGQQTAVKFTGAGVTASVVDAALVVDIPAQAAAGAGADKTVQFNAAGTLSGAAGIKVKSPTNGPGYTNHILHANAFTGGCSFETVVAGGSMWTDSAHDVAYDIALQGAVLLKASNINVANNGEIAATKVYLRNTTAGQITCTIDVSTNHFNEIIGLTNPFTIEAAATRVVYMCARKDTSGNVTKSIEG